MQPQRSDEWFAARLGCVTASRVADVMARTKTGYGASRQNYMMQLLCERLTGRREEGYQNAAMLRGVELEGVARSAYELATGAVVIETGFITHPDVPRLGASPDGLVGQDGLLEVKVPNTATHVEFMRSKKPEGGYIWQMQAQMACTGRAWCDFVSFDDRLPEALQYRSVRIWRDEDAILRVLAEVQQFLAELDGLESEMLSEIHALQPGGSDGHWQNV